MPHVLQSNHFLLYFFLGEFLSRNAFVLVVIRAVHTLVDAIVRQIKRRKHHNAVAVKRLLNVVGKRKHFLGQLGNVTREQHACLAVRQSGALRASAGLFRRRFFKYAFNQRAVVFVLLGVFECCQHLRIVNKFFCF